jgi:hypothetical protein
MGKMTWIVLAAVVGIGLAILIGVTGSATAESPAEAQQNLCTSLGNLNAATESLEGLSPQTASKSDYQSAVSGVDDAWDDVTSDAKDVKTADTSALNGAWNEFTQAVQAVPGDASVSDALQSISQSAQKLVSTTQSTLGGLGCS